MILSKTYLSSFGDRNSQMKQKREKHRAKKQTKKRNKNRVNLLNIRLSDCLPPKFRLSCSLNQDCYIPATGDSVHQGQRTPCPYLCESSFSFRLSEWQDLTPLDESIYKYIRYVQRQALRHFQLSKCMPSS